MGAVLFDTLSYAKKLKEAGFSEKQAEVQAEALAEAVSGRLVTKEDLDAAKREIGSELKVIKWMLGALITMVIGIILVLLSR
jgi:hypothetical protein